MSRIKSDIAINSIVPILMFILLLNYTHTNKNTKLLSNCERYHNWAWIHAPRDGLVSQVNDLDGI